MASPISGTVDAGASTVAFVDLGKTITSAGMSFNNVSIYTGGNITFADNMTVAGNLTLAAASALFTHTIFVGGNLTVNDNLANSSAFTTGITLNGTGAQTITVVGGGAPPTGTFTINKASGTATLASDLPVNYSGQTLTVTSGRSSPSGCSARSA